MQRSCADATSPFKGKCWTNSGGPLVNSLLWEVNSHPCAGTGSPAAGLTQPGPSGSPLSGKPYISPQQSFYSQCCGSASFWCRSGPNFHVDADPDPDRHQKNADPQADPTPKFYICWKIRNFATFSQSIVTLQCFIFLISVRCVLCFQYFKQYVEISGKKSTL